MSEIVWQSRIGGARRVASRRVTARHGTAALAGHRVSTHGMVRHVSAVTHGHGMASLGPAGLAWVHHGTAAMDWHAEFSSGASPHGSPTRGAAWQQRQGKPRQVAVSAGALWHGSIGSAWSGMARGVEVWLGNPRQLWKGVAWPFEPCLVRVALGMARQQWHGALTLGQAPHGPVRQERRGTACLGNTRQGVAATNIDHPRGSAAGGAQGRRTSHRKG